MAERVEVIDVDFSKVTQEAESAAKSVDNLADSFDDLNKSSDKINSTLKETADSLDNISNNESKIQSLVDGLGGLADTASGIAGAFGAVEGAMNLMGVESEDITKSILKMQSIMAITDGFDAIGRGVKGFYEMTQAVKTSTIAIKTLSVAKKADAIITATLTKAVQGFTASTTAATVATKVLKTTLITSGIGAIVVGIGYAIDFLIERVNAFKDESSNLGDNIQKNFNTKDGSFNALASNIGLIVESDIATLNKSIKQITDAYNSGSITLQEQYEQLSKLYSENIKRMQAYLQIDNISDENRNKIQSELDNLVSVQDALNAKIEEIENTNSKLNEERNNQLESTKSNLSALNKELSDFEKSQLEIFTDNANSKRNNSLSVIENSLKQGLISEEEYLIKKTQINAMYDKIIADKSIEITKQEEEEKLGIIEEALAQRFDSITNELDTRMQNLYDEYNLKITEAETQGNTIEAAQLKIELLKEEAALLEEIKGKYQDVGGVSGVKSVESASKQNKADTISAEGGLFDAKVGAITESLTSVADTANEIISIGDGIDSAWGNVFSNMINGVDKVSKSLKSGEKGWKTYGSIMNSTLSVGASIMNALANEQNTDTKEGFERQKKFQIAGATMSMLSGIMDAWSGAMKLPWPMNLVVGGANSAMIATLGAIQIAKIKATQFEGGGSTSDASSGATATATPSMTALQSMQSGVGITTNVQGASTEGQVTDTRVYVLESDIANTTRKVNVAESEATF